MGKKMVKIRPRVTGDSVLPSKSITKLDFVTGVSASSLPAQNPKILGTSNSSLCGI